MALNLAPFGRWTLRNRAAQRRLALRYKRKDNIMSTDEKSRDKRENKFAEAIAEIAHSQMGYYIGFGIFVLAIGIAIRWDGHLFSQKGCINVQEINEKYFKVNSCSGEVEEINVEKAKEIESKNKADENASNK